MIGQLNEHARWPARISSQAGNGVKDRKGFYRMRLKQWTDRMRLLPTAARVAGPGFSCGG